MKKTFIIPRGNWPLNYMAYSDFFKSLGYEEKEEDADFLVLPGGIDVGLLAERDEKELGLLHKFIQEEKHTVAICRGFQLSVINDGGEIIQDIPDSRWFYKHTTITGHWTGESSWHKTSLGFSTNSRHHQGFRKIPESWKILDKTCDGVIEAAEKNNVLGVQWHPEHPEMKNTTAEEWFVERVRNLLSS